MEVHWSDEHLLYLYQENYFAQSWEGLMYLRYQKLLFSYQQRIYQRFFYLPWTLRDFTWMQFVALRTAMQSFQTYFKKSFKNYLLQIFHWQLLNYVRQLWFKKNAIHHRALPWDRVYDTSRIATNNLQQLHHDQKIVLQQAMQHLSSRERVAIEQAWQGVRHALSSAEQRQRANALYRAQTKLKALVHQRIL